MSKRSKIVAWLFTVLVLVGGAIYILGPVLFASVAYPLPTQYQGSVAKWTGEYCQGVDDAPNLLAALIMTESGWHTTSRSGAGAVGLTQFIPSTARGVAKNLGVSPFTPDDLISNPDMAIRFGAYYLCTKIKNYGGSVNKALISYNGGGGAVIAYEVGTPVYGTVAYSNKIQSIEKSYLALYGKWWLTPSSGSGSTSGTGSTTSETTPTQQFNVTPQTDLSVVTKVPLNTFWQNILVNNSNDSGTSSSISNLWKVFLPTSN